MTPYYDEESTRDQYLRFHYPEPGRDELAELVRQAGLDPAVLPPFEERFPLAVRGFWDPAPDGRALDLGCACGRMTLELARDHRAALGVDRSRRLVEAAARVAREGRARYDAVSEGRLRRRVDIPLEVAGRRVAFVVGDAQSPPFPPGSFATVLALNLLCRVAEPARCLAAAADLVRPGGLLVVASPYTRMEEYADPARWLGGFTGADGRPVQGADGIREVLRGRGFALEREARLLFYIPTHDRSGQLAVTHVQRLRRP